MYYFSKRLEKLEKDIYMRAYLFFNKNQTLAAKSLEISRGTFIYKMKYYFGENIFKRTLK